jgi:uncharacterized delta-60 repeat protein
LDQYVNLKVLEMKILVMTICCFLVTVISWAQDGSNDLSFNSGQVNLGDGPSREVRFVALQADGKLIITGDFISYDGKERNKIARLNPDGRLDTTFNPGTGISGTVIQATEVITVLLPDGKIIIAGDFSNYNGVTRNNIARVNADGSLDDSFNSGTGANGIISSVVRLPDGKFIIVGGFTSYNGTPIEGFARLNSDGSLDTLFNPGTGPNFGISKVISLPDEKLIIVGSFTSYNGIPRNRIAKLNSDGSLDTTFNPGTGPNNQIFTVFHQADGKLVIGGAFTSYNGIAINRIARLNTDGSLDTDFNSGTGANNRVTTAALQSDGKIIIGGTFTAFNGTAKNLIARLNVDGSLDAGFNPVMGTNSVIIAASQQPDGKIIIGGFFNSINSIGINHIARLNADGSLDTDFNRSIGANRLVAAVALQPDGKILMGGFFSSYNGKKSNKVARLHPDGSLDTSFDSGEGTDRSVSNIVLQPDGKILIGGWFNSYNGVEINHIARLLPNGTLDSSFKSGLDPSGSVSAIALQPDGKILIGGSFTHYNKIKRTYIARLHSDGSLDNSFFSDSYANLPVYTITLQQDGKIFIGGAFDHYNNTERNGLARLHSDGSLDTSFEPELGTKMKPDHNVEPIVVQEDGKVLIGGNFLIKGSNENKWFARFHEDGSLDATFDLGTGVNNRVTEIVIQSDSKILLAGWFTSYKGIGRNRIARLFSDGNLDYSFDPGSGANSNISSLVIQPDYKILIGGDFTSYDNFSRVRINRLLNSIELEKDEEAPVPDKETLAVFQAQCIVHFENLNIPTATDNVDGTVQGTTNVGIFPITTQGSTIITWTYTDAAGNSSTQNQEILIADTEKPIIALPNNIIQPTDARSCEAGLSISLPTVTDNCNTGIIATGVRSDGLPLNEPFALGITTITWTAVDGAGNQANEVQQNISVIDEEKPIIEGVSPLVQSSDIGSCGAILTIIPPLASDNCDNPVATGTRSDGLELSEVFPIGVTIITWSAKDASGNEADVKTQMVTVLDEEDPKIVSLPSDIEKFNDPGLCGALVNWTAPTVTDNCGGSTITQTSGPANGSIFPIGTTLVTYTATDNSGNSYSETFTVRVIDNQAPSVLVKNYSLQLDNTGNATLSVSDINNGSSDNCSTAAELIYELSKSAFTISDVGVNMVTLIIIDAVGNSNSANATVTVLTPKNLSSENLDFIIFPNPAISETKILVNLIEEATVTISLYDAAGKLLIRNESFRAGSFIETFLLDGLAPGLYNIKLQVGNTSKSKRLIKW